MRRTILEMRLARGWSQQVLADKVGTYRRRISDIERGVCGAHPDEMKLLASAFECGVEDLAIEVARQVGRPAVEGRAMLFAGHGLLPPARPVLLPTGEKTRRGISNPPDGFPPSLPRQGWRWSPAEVLARYSADLAGFDETHIVRRLSFGDYQDLSPQHPGSLVQSNVFVYTLYI